MKKLVLDFGVNPVRVLFKKAVEKDWFYFLETLHIK
jgi:hypothetical protein